MEQSLLVLGIVLLAAAVIPGIYAFSQDTKTYCNSDDDCACGVYIETGDCFYGNKDYVDITEQCPDFCTGIAGNLKIKCVNSTCVQMQV
jgi:hypothetical protein